MAESVSAEPTNPPAVDTVAGKPDAQPTPVNKRWDALRDRLLLKHLFKGPNSHVSSIDSVVILEDGTTAYKPWKSFTPEQKQELVRPVHLIFVSSIEHSAGRS
jgi:hypothetical protein